MLAVVFVIAQELIFDARDVGRQKAEQVELAPLLVGEGAPLVERRIIQKQLAGKRRLYNFLAGLINPLERNRL